MDLHEQEYFIAIAEQGNLSRAARKLGVSQSALSQYLAKAEQQADAKLVERGGSALTLTNAGQLYLDCCRKNVDTWTLTAKKIDNILYGEASHITIAVHAHATIAKVIDVVEEMKKENPKLQLTVRDMRSAAAPELLLKGKIQLAFASYITKNPLLNYIDYRYHKLGLLMKKDHPLAKYSVWLPGQEKLMIPLSMVGDYQMIMMDEDTIVGQNQMRWMREQHYTPVVAATATFSGFIPDLVRQIGHVGLVAEDDARIAGAEFAFVKLENSLISCSAIICRQDMVNNPFIRQFTRLYLEKKVGIKAEDAMKGTVRYGSP